MTNAMFCCIEKSHYTCTIYYLLFSGMEKPPMPSDESLPCPTAPPLSGSQYGDTPYPTGNPPYPTGNPAYPPMGNMPYPPNNAPYPNQ